MNFIGARQELKLFQQFTTTTQVAVIEENMDNSVH